MLGTERINWPERQALMPYRRNRVSSPTFFQCDRSLLEEACPMADTKSFANREPRSSEDAVMALHSLHFDFGLLPRQRCIQSAAEGAS